MTLKVYLICSVIFTLFMFTIWSKSGLLNVLIKFATLILAICGIVVTLRVIGF